MSVMKESMENDQNINNVYILRCPTEICLIYLKVIIHTHKYNDNCIILNKFHFSK